MLPRVLLVDEDRNTLAQAKRWLQEAEYEATTAGSFHEARAALDAQPFDVLIADVRLGAFNGLHLVLLARHRTPRIRAIVTHSPGKNSLEMDARQAGAQVYLAKPLKRWELLSAVEAAAHTKANEQAVLRRWPRVRLARSLEGRIAHTLALVLDVSYGGVRVETVAPQSGELGSLVQLEVLEPAFSVRLRPVWARESPLPGKWWFGAEVVGSDPAFDERWRSVVDALAAKLTKGD